MSTDPQFKEAAKTRIKELIERFEQQKAAYSRPAYNEMNARKDFIDAFFEALGWDVGNKQGNAEPYREVIHEGPVKEREKSNGRSKVPDYTFRLEGGKRLFFVEAKKPAAAIKDEPSAAYQVRRYGWSANLPLSIVTNFSEFIIYDCRRKPKPTDKAHPFRTKYLTYKDYLDEFDFLWETFSRHRITKGGFDKFAESEDIRGTSAVDGSFLVSLNNWRKLLASSICRNNAFYDAEQITFTVQQIISRLIFLRVAEDRGVEEYGSLRVTITKGDYYSNLLEHFRQADKKYNSGLFNYGGKGLTSFLKIDNKTIKSIIKDLYYPVCPYDFLFIPVEIMGTAYEHFLGKEIVITAGNRVRIVDKPEVRKAGGVYYTPQYVVDYIVENTIRKLVHGKAPKEVSKIRIVDPACGSGSFLLRAYQFLLDYHRSYYGPLFHKYNQEASDPEKTVAERNAAIRERNKLPLTPQGQLKASLKKEILLNNIFGVDLDMNAVQLTKLSLLVQCMEGETSASIQALDFNEHILPSLDNNIITGNSLIDTDFYEHNPSEDHLKKVKPLCWKKAFPSVGKGGFDAVIGNPPYFRIDAALPESNYLRSKYDTPEFKLDIYTLFIEKFVNEGVKNLGFIIPNTLLNNLTNRKLRKLLLERSSISEIVNYRSKVFKAVVSTMILMLDDNKKGKMVTVREVSDNGTETFEVEKEKFITNDNYSFDIRLFGKDSGLFETLKEKSIPLADVCEVKQAIKTGNDDKYIHAVQKKESFKPVIGGSEIRRYAMLPEGRFVDYGRHLACPRNPDIFEAPEKILIRETGNRITATYDTGKYYLLSSLYSVLLKPGCEYNLKYILGVINSSVAQFFMKKLCFDNSAGAFTKARIFHFQQLPVKSIDFSNPEEKQAHDEIVKCVDKLLKMYHDQYRARYMSSMIQRERYIVENEKKIDMMLYRLYRLDERSIAVIEEALIKPKKKKKPDPAWGFE